MKTLLTREFKSSVFTLLGAPEPRVRRLKRTDPNEYGGAPLLGINGVVIIGHGATNAKGVMNGINVAHRHQHNINEHIRKASLKSAAPKRIRRKLYRGKATEGIM